MSFPVELYLCVRGGQPFFLLIQGGSRIFFTFLWSSTMMKPSFCCLVPYNNKYIFEDLSKNLVREVCMRFHEVFIRFNEDSMKFYGCSMKVPKGPMWYLWCFYEVLSVWSCFALMLLRESMSDKLRYRAVITTKNLNGISTRYLNILLCLHCKQDKN